MCPPALDTYGHRQPDSACWQAPQGDAWKLAQGNLRTPRDSLPQAEGPHKREDSVERDQPRESRRRKQGNA